MHPVPLELRAKRRTREPEPALMSVDGGCRYLGEASRSSLYELAALGLVEFVKLRGRTMVTFPSLKRLAENLPKYQPRKATDAATAQSAK